MTPDTTDYTDCTDPEINEKQKIEPSVLSVQSVVQRAELQTRIDVKQTK